MIGGEDCMQMVGYPTGHLRTDRGSPGILRRHSTLPAGAERYWDTVPLKYFLDDYTVYYPVNAMQKM